MTDTITMPLTLTSRKHTDNELIEKLLSTEAKVHEIASGDIIYSPALITREGIPIIINRTINVIQGRAGAHKSRLAQMFCSLLLDESRVPNSFLGFNRIDEEMLVCYIDTERNRSEELPAAIQSIKSLAGYHKADDLPNFRFTSLKDIPKKQRLKALTLYLEKIRSKCQTHIFLVLDVVTDCVENFNDPVESLNFFDFIGNLTENYNVTVLLVIHENPGSDKARGHVGTEAINKASTVLHIGYERANRGETSNLLQLGFVKLRHSSRLPRVPLVFSKNTQTLQIAGQSEIQASIHQDRSVANIEDVRVKLGIYLKTPFSQKQLLDALRVDFDCSDNTMKKRLTKIEEDKILIPDEDGVAHTLNSIQRTGKATLYELIEYKEVLVF